MEARQESYSVNASNFLKLAKTYVEKSGGFLIAMRDGENQGVEFKATQRQWGAWRAYFKTRGLKTGWMDAIAQTSMTEAARKTRICMTVPSEWPHEFDREAGYDDDMIAAESFLRNFRAERPHLADAARRATTIAAYKRWRTDNPGKSWMAEPAPRESLIDVDALMAGYDKDVAEERARQAAKEKRQQSFTVPA